MFYIHSLDLDSGRIVVQLNKHRDGSDLSAPVHMQVMVPVVSGQFIVGEELIAYLTTEHFAPVWDRVDAVKTATNSSALVDFVAGYVVA